MHGEDLQMTAASPAYVRRTAIFDVLFIDPKINVSPALPGRCSRMEVLEIEEQLIRIKVRL